MINTTKVYYSIKEVCDTTDLEAHVLRYWENEFSVLRPKKNRAGNRAYRKKDIEIVERIKYLLYDEQYTIPGARKKLSEKKEIIKNNSPATDIEPRKESSPSKTDYAETISELKSILKELT